MSTYTDLFCCFPKSRKNNVKARNQSLKTRNENMLLDSDYPDEDDPNDSYIPNPNVDALSLLETRLQTMQINYMRKMAYWQKKKLEILAANSLQDEVDHTQKKRINEIFKKVFEEIKAFFQAPETRLHDVLEKVSPHILELGGEINQSCDKLKQLPNNPKSEEERGKLRLAICNSSIDVLSGFISLTNDVSREIKLCVKLEEILEKTAITLLNFVTTLFTRFPLPTFDFNFNFGPLYRKYLYKEIAPETNRIEKFMVNSEGPIERGKRALTGPSNELTIAGTGKKPEVKNLPEEKSIILPGVKSPQHSEQFFQKAPDMKHAAVLIKEPEALAAAAAP